MENQTAYEQTLISIARTLPPDRIEELVNFARFLQILSTTPSALESEDEWDMLLAKPEAQRVMTEMAREAREEFRAGRAPDITSTKGGRLAPK